MGVIRYGHVIYHRKVHGKEICKRPKNLTRPTYFLLHPKIESKMIQNNPEQKKYSKLQFLVISSIQYYAAAATLKTEVAPSGMSTLLLSWNLKSVCLFVSFLNFFGQFTQGNAFISYAVVTHHEWSALKPTNFNLPHSFFILPKNNQKWVFIKYDLSYAAKRPMERRF